MIEYTVFRSSTCYCYSAIKVIMNSGFLDLKQKNVWIIRLGYNTTLLSPELALEKKNTTLLSALCMV